MSPILVRPVREQLEHDRIIRLLQSKLRRKYEAGMNPGSEQNAPVASGDASVYPDLVLVSQERGHRLQGVIEVETGESVNHLEALSQWAHFGRLRAPFHLYVPAGMVDVARRLCEDNRIQVHEIWSYHSVGEEIRFTLVHKNRDAAAPVRARAAEPAVPARRKTGQRVAGAGARKGTERRVPRGARPGGRSARSDQPGGRGPRSDQPGGRGPRSDQRQRARTSRRKS